MSCLFGISSNLYFHSSLGSNSAAVAIALLILTLVFFEWLAQVHRYQHPWNHFGRPMFYCYSRTCIRYGSSTGMVHLDTIFTRALTSVNSSFILSTPSYNKLPLNRRFCSQFSFRCLLFLSLMISNCIANMFIQDLYVPKRPSHPIPFTPMLTEQT